MLNIKHKINFLYYIMFIYSWWIKRICLFAGGLFVMAGAVGFSIASVLGTTPISSISYSLTLITDINIGIITFIFNTVLIIIQIPILRHDFKSKVGFTLLIVFYSVILLIWHCILFHLFLMILH